MACFQLQIRSLLIVLAAVSLVPAHTALGADLGAGAPAPIPLAPTQWKVSVTPYGWLPFLTGDVTVKGRAAQIDVTPIEVVENLDAIPWMSYIEARRGPLAFYNDIFYAKLGVDVSRARSLSGLTLDTTLGADFTQAVIEVGGAYEVTKWCSSGSAKNPDAFSRCSAIDLLAGARYWHQDLSINLALTGLDTTGLVLAGGRAIARSGSVDWIDPLVGVRLRHQLAPGQELVLRGDIGGFGVGSEFSWNLLGAYSWQIAAPNGVTYAGIVGYRLLSVDYQQGSGVNRYEYDVLQHGPLLGLTVGF
jgi:hypothetical protein